MKVALAVPALPSVTVTSSTDSDGSGSSSVIVPEAEVVRERRVAGVREADREALVYLVTRVTYKGDVDGSEVSPGAKVSSAARRV